MYTCACIYMYMYINTYVYIYTYKHIKKTSKQYSWGINNWWASKITLTFWDLFLKTTPLVSSRLPEYQALLAKQHMDDWEEKPHSSYGHVQSVQIFGDNYQVSSWKEPSFRGNLVRLRLDFLARPLIVATAHHSGTCCLNFGGHT